MDVLADLKKIMVLVRSDDNNISSRFYILLLDYVIITANMIFFLVERWDNIDDRINTLKAFMFLTLFMGIGLYYISCWGEFRTMVHMFDELNFRFPYKMSPERENIIRSLLSDMRSYNRLWILLPRIYLSSTAVVPIAIVVIKVTWFREDFYDVIKETSAIPFPLYFPKCIAKFHNYESLLSTIVYISAYTLHMLFGFYGTLYGALANVSSLSAISNVQHELQLLRLSLLEMDNCIQQRARSTDISLETSMRSYVKYLVRHHQDACRRYQTSNKGVRWIVAIINIQASFCMCASIYMIVQKDIFLKMQEMIFFATWTGTIFLFDYSGEKVSSQNEMLRNTFYESSWIDKPEWFKSSLLIAMTFSSKPKDIKPFGVFALNLNSFVLTMKAAYTYYNVLHNMKNA